MKPVTLTRPALLKIAAIIGLVMVIFAIPSIFSPFIKKLGTLFPLLFGSLVSLRFIALIGIWYMKKWGPILFFLVFIVYELTSMYLDISHNFELPLSLVIGIIFLYYVPVMDDNL